MAVDPLLVARFKRPALLKPLPRDAPPDKRQALEKLLRMIREDLVLPSLKAATAADWEAFWKAGSPDRRELFRD